MGTGLTTIDVLVLVGYGVMITVMGIYFAKRNTDTEAYFVGGRSMSGWVVGLSLVGTSISSITFLSFPADNFKTGWLRFIGALALPLAVVVAAYVFLPFFRRTPTTTAYQYLERRFGPSVRAYGAGAFVIGQVVRVSMILYLMGVLMHEMLNVPTVWCILIGGIIVAVYTVVGGIEAVIWTDVVQTVILALGGVVCLGMIIHEMPGGLHEILEIAQRDQKLSVAEWRDGVPHQIGWGITLQAKTITMLFLAGLVIWLTEYSCNQNIVQRYCTSRSMAEARKAMLVCVCASLPIWAFYRFLGTSLYAFFQRFPTPDTTAMLDGTIKAEHVLPFYILHYLPPGITGLVIAAALAAAMSSLDSSINAISTVTVTDFYRRHFVKDKSEKHYLAVAWIAAGVAAVLMIGGAIVLTLVETKTLEDTASVLVSLLAAGLFGMYALGFFTKRGDERAVWIGIVFTVLFTAWTVAAARAPQWLPERLAVPFDLYYTGMIGNLVMFIIGYLIGCMLPRRADQSLDELTVWTIKQREDLVPSPEAAG